MVILPLLLCAVPLVAAWGATDMIGNGRWITKNVAKCPDDSKYTTKLEISRKKVNRTHDGFNLNGDLDFVLDNEHGIFIDACKYMDGGCKPYQTFADDCACCFLKKHAESNMVEIFTKAGIDPPDCPIPKGALVVKDYVFNYNALPEKGIYGTYDAKIYLLQPKVGENPPEKIGCVLLTLQFENETD
ncbi:uncharacterized protein LOC115445528 [Manduca sexta]|uniref:uncharacterized protein LOC115445528 n=1 Tax=Manduca sexta TaxID=7130 RepID=UPI0018905A05|nr:uncharacterized protein LOC115445528 [Manduca sexta]